MARKQQEHGCCSMGPVLGWELEQLQHGVITVSAAPEQQVKAAAAQAAGRGVQLLPAYQEAQAWQG